MAATLTTLLAELPPILREELIGAFIRIEHNFREGRWEPSELNGGKLCEVVYSILRGHVDGTFPERASKPRNVVDACRALENAPTNVPRSIRIHIPRVLIAMYDFRSNRGVGHVGGDVDPNYMDAMCVLHMAKWIVAELIRVYHDVSPEEADAAVAALSDREISLVWSVGGIRRVLDNKFTMMEKTLLLLYGAPAGVPEADLIRSIEHSNPSVYRRDVLRKAHSDRWIEYREDERVAIISPLGSEQIERKLQSRKTGANIIA